MPTPDVDPLVQRIEADWNSVAHGGALDALQRDLMQLRARDVAPGMAPDKYGQDIVAINIDLMQKNLLPNMQLLGARDNQVVVLDLARHDQPAVLQQGPGMVQVVDMDVARSRERLVLKSPEAADARPDIFKQPITPDGVHQGASVPDCKLEARLASLAQADPQAIARMIKDNGNGTYTVTFPGDKQHPQTVTAPTDWERATFSNGAEAGADAGYGWALIVDKAYRQRIHQPFGPYGPANDVEGLLTGKEEALLIPLAVECTTVGNMVDWAMSKMDNTAVCAANLSHEPLARQVETARQKAVAALPADTGKYLQEALNNHMIVNTFVDPDKLKVAPEGDKYGTDSQGRKLALMDHHAYTVTAYDAARQTVTLRNPWGVNIDDKGEVMGNGYVTVPMAQFKRMMPALDVELTERSR